MKIKTNTYIFTFGKYKGRRFTDVLEENASYIRWCHWYVEWFELSVEDYGIVVDEVRQQISYNTPGLSAQIEYGLEVYGNDIIF